MTSTARSPAHGDNRASRPCQHQQERPKELAEQAPSLTGHVAKRETFSRVQGWRGPGSRLASVRMSASYIHPVDNEPIGTLYAHTTPRDQQR